MVPLILLKGRTVENLQKMVETWAKIGIYSENILTKPEHCKLMFLQKLLICLPSMILFFLYAKNYLTS